MENQTNVEQQQVAVMELKSYFNTPHGVRFDYPRGWLLNEVEHKIEEQGCFAEVLNAQTRDVICVDVLKLDDEGRAMSKRELMIDRYTREVALITSQMAGDESTLVCDFEADEDNTPLRGYAKRILSGDFLYTLRMVTDNNPETNDRSAELFNRIAPTFSLITGQAELPPTTVAETGVVYKKYHNEGLGGSFDVPAYWQVEEVECGGNDVCARFFDTKTTANLSINLDEKIEAERLLSTEALLESIVEEMCCDADLIHNSVEDNTCQLVVESKTEKGAPFRMYTYFCVEEEAVRAVMLSAIIDPQTEELCAEVFKHMTSSFEKINR